MANADLASVQLAVEYSQAREETMTSQIDCGRWAGWLASIAMHQAQSIERVRSHQLHPQAMLPKAGSPSSSPSLGQQSRVRLP
jgi:hypothetical protein